MPSQAKPKTLGASRTAKPSKRTAQRPSTAAAKAKPSAQAAAKDDSAEIGQQILAQGDWRGKTMSRVRSLIQQADPDVVEEIKWRKPSNAMKGVPVWSHDGMICTGETYKDKLKFTFAKGAALPDPAGLFNAADTGATRRAIDLFEGDEIDAKAFKALVKAAVALNAG